MAGPTNPNPDKLLLLQDLGALGKSHTENEQKTNRTLLQFLMMIHLDFYAGALFAGTPTDAAGTITCALLALLTVCGAGFSQ